MPRNDRRRRIAAFLAAVASAAVVLVLPGEAAADSSWTRPEQGKATATLQDSSWT